MTPAEGTDRAQGLAASEEEAIAEWLEANIGPVTSITRQGRWRPVWFADVQRDGDTLPLCVRGDRVDSVTPWDLEHEMTLFVELERAGIPVPHVYGWIDGLRAFVMDRVPGQSDFSGSTEAENRAGIDAYLATLARMHHLDVRPFAEAGITRADRPELSGSVGFQRVEAADRSSKTAPDPMTEFLLGWFRRNPLDNRGRASRTCATATSTTSSPATRSSAAWRSTTTRSTTTSSRNRSSTRCRSAQDSPTLR